MGDVPRFDLFSGTPEWDATWIDAIDGLTKARDRMERLAADKPGRYFIFSTPRSTVVMEIDTTPTPATKRVSSR